MYVPLAERLGVHIWKTEFEELFRRLPLLKQLCIGHQVAVIINLVLQESVDGVLISMFKVQKVCWLQSGTHC